MILYHRLKSGKAHEIPLTKPKFFTVKEELAGAEATDKGWLIRMQSEQDGKYKDHGFDLLIAAEDVERMYEVLGQMKTRFKKEQQAFNRHAGGDCGPQEAEDE
jgi:hypothetical protein